MSTFTAHLQTLATDEPQQQQTTPSQTNEHHHHNNPHAVPNPSDTSALFRLLQDQMGTLALTAPTPSNRAFLESLVSALDLDVEHPPVQITGVSQEFLDGLDRVPRRALKEEDECPICAERFLDDKYCLVVELPCHRGHRFDLECVGPWLRGKGSCPLCRAEVGRRKVVETTTGGEEEEDDMDGLYA